MMANIKSMRGTSVDIDRLVQENSNSVAITGGGVRMNAAGAIVGFDGTIIKTAADVDAEYGSKIAKTTQQVSIGDLDKYKGIVTTKHEELSDEEKKDLEQKKTLAKKAAKRVELSTEGLISGGQPVIKKYTDPEADDAI